MPDSVDLGHAVTLPPQRAIDYFKSKDYEISWNWFEVWQEQHAKAFTVAKVAKTEVLASIRSAQQRALSEGLTERQFIKELEPRLRAQGWWGRQFVAGAEGIEVAQLGSPWRLKNIYRTNTFSSYNVGRYRAQDANRRARPYWQYLQIQRENKRPAHAIFHQRVFAADDPIWQMIYPPNGFGCACRVRALTEQQLGSMHVGVEKSAGKLGTKVVDAGVDKRTGEIVQREVYTFTENGETVVGEPGWSYNPGESWSLHDPAADTPDILSGTAATGVTKIKPGQKSWSDYGRPAAAAVPQTQRPDTPPILTPGKGRAAAEAIINTALGLAAKPTRVIQTPVSQIALRPELVAGVAGARNGARERFANLVLPTLQDPFEIYLTEYADASYRERYIGLFKDGALVLRVNKDGSLYWEYITGSELEKLNAQRSGVLLWSKADA